MRSNLNLFAEGQTWRGLKFRVAGEPKRPPLRPEVMGPLRFALLQGRTEIFEAAIADDWYGADMQWRGEFRSPIAPMSTRSAAELDDPDTAVWLQRWAHRMVDALSNTDDGPLFAGEWIMRPMRFIANEPSPVRDLSGTDPVPAGALVDAFVDEINWDGTMPKSVVPMRELDPPDASRVKAWRKLVQAETLPPVVTWNITALSASLIVDGHDRLAAALAEGRSPVMLDLSERHVDGHGALNQEMRRLERAIDDLPDMARAHEGLATAAMRAAAIDDERIRTTAWTNQ